jgi:hypothetical protein
VIRRGEAFRQDPSERPVAALGAAAVAWAEGQAMSVREAVADALAALAEAPAPTSSGGTRS